MTGRKISPAPGKAADWDSEWAARQRDQELALKAERSPFGSISSQVDGGGGIWG